MQTRYYYVYIATNKTHKVLYTGVTNNVYNRIGQHKDKISSNSFTAKYNINKLVYYETYTDVYSALNREKQIKAGSRQDKLNLISGLNPNWKDLATEEL